MSASATLLSLLRSLRTSEKHSTLGISPNELDLLSIAVVIYLFIARTIKYALGSGLAFVPVKVQNSTVKKSESPADQIFALPDLSLYMPLRLDVEDRRCFYRAVKSDAASKSDEIINNAQICLFLAAVSEPAMLLLLAKQGCPVRPLGAVNVRNRFEILKPDACHSLFINPTEDLQENPQLSVLAKFPRPARRVRKGLEIDIEVSIITNPEGNNAGAPEHTSGVIQSASSAIFRQEFTMLQFMKFSGGTLPYSSTKSDTQQPVKPSGGVHDTVLTTYMDTSSPSLWARLCKDYNPIHFSSMLAKLLGQPGQLAHGNHAVGICLQAMSHFVHDSFGVSSKAAVEAQQLDVVKQFVLENVENTAYGSKGWWMEVRFRRPIVLPASLGPKINDAANSFDVLDIGTGKTTVEVNVGIPKHCNSHATLQIRSCLRHRESTDPGQ